MIRKSKVAGKKQLKDDKEDEKKGINDKLRLLESYRFAF